MSSALVVKDLTLTFGGLTAVKDLSFAVPPQSVVAIIGPNGAGKTSAFNAITGVYVPTSGSIECDGARVESSLSGLQFVLYSTASILAGLGAIVLLNAQSLWQAVIDQHYRYQEPFPWQDAMRSGFSFFGDLHAPWTLAPFLTVFLLTLIGLLIAAARSRISPETAAAHGLARTFQNIRLFRHLTVLQNVLISIDRKSSADLIGALFRTPSFRNREKERCQKASQALEIVGLADKGNEISSSLPYGMQRRLEIARAMATGASILLLDEPAAGMNPSEGQELMELIGTIRARGITIILIEHHMRVVMGISDQIVVLQYGYKIAEGSPEQIRSNPAVIEAYLGTGAHGKRS